MLVYFFLLLFSVAIVVLLPNFVVDMFSVAVALVVLLLAGMESCF